MSSLAFEPLVPAALWIVLAAVSTGVLGWYFWLRPPTLSGPRWGLVATLAAAGMTMVLVVLLNPLWLEPIPPPAGKPLLTVLLDRSASMRITDVGEESRLAAGAKIAQLLPKTLSGQFDVQVQTFAAITSPSSPDEISKVSAEGQSTDLARAISESLDGERPQGQAMVLLSDGIHNAPGGSAAVMQSVAAARAMAVPIYTTTLGGSAGLKDLDLTLNRQQELAFISQKVPLRVNLRQRGTIAAEAEVVLLQESKEIDRQKIRVPADGAASTVFQVSQPKTGLYRYEVRCQNFPAEATSENNASTFVLRTVDRPVRVLLLEGKPYWDAKFLMKTLAQDASLEIDGIIRVSEGRFLQRNLRLAKQAVVGSEDLQRLREETTEILKGPPAVLNDAAQLGAYQVIVLGRDAEEFLTDEVLERLRTWISKDGGSLICYRGAPVASVNQKLARLMPVRWNPASEARFRVSLTGRGQDLNWIPATTAPTGGLSRMPSLATTAKPERPTPLAVVLAQGEGGTQPVVTYQPYGTGRVVAVEGAGMWRWAFLAPAYQQDEPVYDSLWQGLMRWLISGAGLAPGQNAALRSDRVTFFTEEAASATLLVRDEVVSAGVPDVELKTGDGKTAGNFKPAPSGDEPGVYRVLFGPLPPGQYTATAIGNSKDAAASIAFDVRTNAAEQLDVAARPDLMEKIAEESGGEVLVGAQASDIAQRFQQHLAKSRPVQIRQIPLWDRTWVLVTIVACWGLAWGIRRAGGLI
jgi:hypothetical protein